MPLRLAINGFGRIGRAAFRVARERTNLQVVAINDIAEPKALAHLLQYDSVYRKFPAAVGLTADGISVAGQTFRVLAVKEPERLPWRELDIDVVLECTGRFTRLADAGRHLQAGAKRVVLSAPPKDEASDEIPTLVLGTARTRQALEAADAATVVSNASCTTNCIAPVIEVMTAAFGVSKAMMTTIHAYTADQNLVDGPHRDLRRSRAAAENMVPTSTGAARATARVVPELRERFDGIAIRVPTACVSLSDITAVVNRPVTVAEVNDAFRQAARQAALRPVLGVCEEPLVSSDFIGDPRSAIVDTALTRVVGGDLVKVLAWYDNEWGYATRLVELAQAFGSRRSAPGRERRG